MLIVYMFIIEFVDSAFFLSKELSFIAVLFRYLYSFFFQSVLLQPLEANLVRTNNKCILGLGRKTRTVSII